MYSAPEGYEAVAKCKDRSETIVMSLGIFIDNTSADDMVSAEGLALPMSNGEFLIDSRYDLDNELATFEANGIPTAESNKIIVPPIEPSTTVNTGWWSAAISDEDGDIDFTMQVTFEDGNGNPAVHTSALTVYTDGPDVLEAEVIFSKNGVQTSVTPTYHYGYFVASGAYEYDSITIRITKLDAPYRHIRLTELEFGDSITISPTKLTNRIVYIDEIDPLQQGLPMRELDFDLINVNGDYDEDNPNTHFDRLAIGNPITLSYTLCGSADQNYAKYTVPMGRFVLAERGTKDGCLSVTAYDTRWYLGQMCNAWSISTSEDLGTTLDRLLTALEIGHVIEEDVYLVYPTVNHSFDTGTTVLDDVQRVAQAYGLTIIPNRVGTIVVGTDYSDDEYGTIPPNIQFSWPESSQMNRYNFIDIMYGSGHYTRDLRSDVNAARVVLSVNNSLIGTEANAITVCNRVAGRLYSKAVKVEWAGDPAIDLGDSAGVYSMWSLNGTAEVYKTIKRQITFDGMLTEETTFIK